MTTGKLVLLLTAAAAAAGSTSAFVAPGVTTSPSAGLAVPTTATTYVSPLFSSSEKTAAEIAQDRGVTGEEAPKMNPDNPNLPELKGDYDWDARHANDPDWLTENVPGKMVLNEIEIASTATELGKIEAKYRKIRLDNEYEEARIIGFVPQAEMYNGRAAMFFLTVGLLTELWTGVTFPGQIETMARVGGFIGPDY